MLINKIEFHVMGLSYTIRSAVKEDAKQLSALRLQVDGETEHMDRVPGERIASCQTAGITAPI